jgi:hypothetical protein
MGGGLVYRVGGTGICRETRGKKGESTRRRRDRSWMNPQNESTDRLQPLLNDHSTPRNKLVTHKVAIENMINQLEK